MENKRFLHRSVVLAVIMILVFSLTACLRQASKGPETGEAPAPDETQSMGELDINLIATQTAMAQQVVAGVATATPAGVLVATATPEAGGGQTEQGGEQPQPGGGEAEQGTGSEAGGGQEQPQQPASAEVVATPGIPKSYTLQKGEFPFCIARRFNVDQYEMLAVNGLGLNSKVPVGFTMQIPQTGHPFVGDPELADHPTDYTVKSGDTIYTIACKFGNVSPDMILLANGMDSADDISSGNTIHIP